MYILIQMYIQQVIEIIADFFNVFKSVIFLIFYNLKLLLQFFASN